MVGIPGSGAVMDAETVLAVERAIDTMRRGLADSLTVDDLAKSALFSKFHFSRVFHDVTGVTPGRFLSAMRIDEAKRLLGSTSLPVLDICHQVGYNSLGTFTMRFHHSVGVPPGAYREIEILRRATSVALLRGAREGGVRIHGDITTPSGPPAAAVLVGLFGSRLAEGIPVRFTLLDDTSRFRLDDVPVGAWWLLAYTLPPGDELTAETARTSWWGVTGPVEIGPGGSARRVDLALRPRRAVDPPVLLDHRALLLSAASEN